MTILVTDTGFTADTWDQGYTPFGEAANDVVSIDVPADTNPADIEITPTLKMVRIDFPSFADGRGFTLATARVSQITQPGPGSAREERSAVWVG